MKWKTNDGDEIECTVEEYRELKKGAKKASKTEQTPQKGVHRTAWTKKEKRVLREQYSKENLVNLAKLLGRSESGVYAKARSIGLARKYKKRNVSKPQKKVFPTITLLDGMGHANMIPLIYHIIHTNGRMNIEEVGRITNPIGKGHWSNKSWSSLLEQLLLKSKQIADYFGVLNKFSINNGDFIYGKGDKK